MAEYHCHYLQGGRRSQVVVEAPDDARALLMAEELLASSDFDAMEIWQGRRLVGQLTDGTPAEWRNEAGRTHKAAADSE